MVKTLVISAYAGVGKSWLAKNGISVPAGVRYTSLTCLDLDSSQYDKNDPHWVQKYMSDIWNAIGQYDFIFVSLRKTVRKELNKLGIPFVTVAPNNTDSESIRDRELTRQQWFGRFLLRDNSHIKDFPTWLEHCVEGYDATMSLDNLTAYEAKSALLLRHDQYLSDIMVDLYKRKEDDDTYDATSVKANGVGICPYACCVYDTLYCSLTNCQKVCPRTVCASCCFLSDTTSMEG